MHTTAQADLLLKYAKARLTVIYDRSGDIATDVRALRTEVEAYAEAWAVPAPAAEVWAPYFHIFEDDA